MYEEWGGRIDRPRIAEEVEGRGMSVPHSSMSHQKEENNKWIGSTKGRAEQWRSTLNTDVSQPNSQRGMVLEEGDGR